ncbi:MAG: PKD domain-containing protein [Saprospiraceae bacterium]|nr:PKD domain-containing protein [Saprospiraceae bacterium]
MKLYPNALQSLTLSAFLLFVACKAFAGPQPVFSATTLDFGEVFVNESRTLTLHVTNAGDAAYIITDVSASPAVFTENIPFAIVEPGDTLAIEVYFSPLTVGPVTGTLTVLSTIGTTTIDLQGVGVEPTTFDFSPDTLAVTLPSGSLDTAALTFTNTGGSTLNFELDFQPESGLGLPVFWESFESTPLDFTVTPEYLAETVADAEAPQGNKVLKLTGGISVDYTGLLYDVEPTQYQYIGYWVKPVSTGGVSAVFRLWTPFGIMFNCWYDGFTQHYNINVIGNTTLVLPMALNEWHHIECKNIDYLLHTFDLYIDGQLVQDNFNWFIETVGITRLQLSNWDNTVSYFDAISAFTSEGTEQLIIFMPQSGAVPAQQTAQVDVVFNAEGLLPGDYTGKVLVTNNSQNQPYVEIPFIITVTPGAALRVDADTLDFGQVYVGLEVSQHLTLSNVGSESLLVTQISSPSPLLSMEPQYGIIQGFDSLDVLVGLTPDAPGPIFELIEIQSTQGSKLVYVRAQADYPAEIRLTPDSLCVTLARGQDSTLFVTIENTGLGMLTYDIPQDGPALNRILDVLALRLPSAYTQALDILRDSSVRVTELQSIPTEPGALDNYDLLLFPREDFTDVWQYMAWAGTIYNYLQSGGGALFLGRPYGDIMSATAAMSGYYYLYPASGNTDIQVLHEDGHPILSGVDFPLQPVSHLYGVTYGNVSNNFHRIISEESSLALLAYEYNGEGRSGFVGYDYVESTVDTRRLLLNATRWLSGRQFPAWLSADQPGGTLPAGESNTIGFTFNADSLSAGVYHYDLTWTSNDPLQNKFTIPVKLMVIDRPEAGFSSDDSYVCDGAVTFTNTTVNGATGYSWDFGDGGTSTEAAPTHIYQQDGVYDVQLIACNVLGCDTLVRENLITVSINGMFCDTLLMPAAFGQTIVGNACTGVLYDSGGPFNLYSNGENSNAIITGEPGTLLRFRIYDVDMESCCDRLDIYDGDPALGAPLLASITGYTPGPLLVYTTGNVAHLSFYSDGSVIGNGFRLLWECGASFPMEANFIYSSGGCRNFITFQNQSIGATEYLWDFGDGESSTEINPLHLYASAGDFEVTLYAINGQDTVSYTNTVNIPEVDFYATVNYPAQASVNEQVIFSVNTSFPLNQIFWNINGNSAISFLPVVATFDQPGVYPVSVTITGTNGCGINYEGTIVIGTTGADEAGSLAGQPIRLSPNPTSGLVQVQIDKTESDPINWQLLDALGRVVEQGIWPGGPRLDARLDLEALPSGVYLLRLQQAARVGTARVVKGRL